MVGAVGVLVSYNRFMLSSVERVRGALFLLDLLCRDLGTVNGCLVGCFTWDRKKSHPRSRSKIGFFCDVTFTNCAVVSGEVVRGND